MKTVLFIIANITCLLNLMFAIVIGFRLPVNYYEDNPLFWFSLIVCFLNGYVSLNLADNFKRKE